MSRKLLLCLPFSPHEIAQARELVKLWVDLEDSFNHEVTLLLFSRFDIAPYAIGEDVVEYAKTRFNVIADRCKRQGKGWPAGCNALEVGAYEWFVEKTRTGALDFEYMMMAETDTVPLRKGWANEIMNEAYDTKAIMLGAYFTKEEGCAHINGNCVLHKEAWKQIKSIWQVPSRRGWDCHIGPRALIVGTPSRLIWQDYRLGAPDNPWKGDDHIFAVKSYGGRKNPLYGQQLKPCFLHGVKTMEGINAVRRRFLQKVA
jgi:hypothetical protein